MGDATAEDTIRRQAGDDLAFEDDFAPVFVVMLNMGDLASPSNEYVPPMIAALARWPALS